jgi:hypothetical protein
MLKALFPLLLLLLLCSCSADTGVPLPKVGETVTVLMSSTPLPHGRVMSINGTTVKLFYSGRTIFVDWRKVAAFTVRRSP